MATDDEPLSLPSLNTFIANGDGPTGTTTGLTGAEGGTSGRVFGFVGFRVPRSGSFLPDSGRPGTLFVGCLVAGLFILLRLTRVST